MTAVTINVTADDIAEGSCGSVMGCPVALAAQRKFGTAIAVNLLKIYAPKKGWSVMTPEPAWKFIRDFDDGSHVSPFTFTIEVP